MQNSNGNTLFGTDFDFRPNRTIYRPKSKSVPKSVFPFEFRIGPKRNRFVRAWRMQSRWGHNLKKITKTFFTIPYKFSNTEPTESIFNHEFPSKAYRMLDFLLLNRTK